MNTYRIKVKQVYIETVFAEAESKEDAIQMVWSDDCVFVGCVWLSVGCLLALWLVL